MKFDKGSLIRGLCAALVLIIYLIYAFDKIFVGNVSLGKIAFPSFVLFLSYVLTIMGYSSEEDDYNKAMPTGVKFGTDSSAEFKKEYYGHWWEKRFIGFIKIFAVILIFFVLSYYVGGEKEDSAYSQGETFDFFYVVTSVLLSFCYTIGRYSYRFEKYKRV